MSTIGYEVIGEHSTPEDFKKYVLALRANQERVPITAKPIVVDELAARRGKTETEVGFEFFITEIHFTDNGYVFGGYMYIDDAKGVWIMIEGTDRVRFDILD